MSTGITLRYPAQTRVSNWLDPYRYGWTQTSVRRDTPPWRIRLKAHVDPDGQTTEFIPFEVYARLL
jgi:hypothetical protein